MAALRRTLRCEALEQRCLLSAVRPTIPSAPSAAPIPVVTGVSPASGPAAGGTTVTIEGTNFTGATAVKFGTAPATIVSAAANQIVVKDPRGIGTEYVTVTTAKRGKVLGR